MSHTPGPWKATLLHGDTFKRGIQGPDGRQIAAIWHHPGQRPKASTGEQEQADTRLIAAAPELLAALKRLREWIRHPGEDDGPENEAVIYQAEAAIKKAEGEVTK